ncbi:MAG: S49 family peptidase [Alphaproteobacteria bacterium]|nr:S49 family peptidase [Alphaproteobacteria bacterium]
MKDFICDLPIIGDFMEHRPKVAVVRLSGVISDNGTRKGGISYERYAEAIEDAFALRDVREVALVINSPGGAPAQCSLLSGVIRHCAAEKKVPVSAFVEDVAASGGYWLACAADKIFVQASSIVGSIGVIAAGFGFEDFIKRHDIKRRLYTSGKDKSLLDPFSPEKKADVERLKAIQAEIHAQFIAWVQERRGNRLKGKDSELFEGAIWTGSTAVGMGVADGIGDLRGVYRDKYGEKVRFINFGPEKPLYQALMGVKARGGAVGEAIGTIEERAFWQRFGL